MSTPAMPPIPCDNCGSRRTRMIGAWKMATGSMTVTTDGRSLTITPPERWTYFLQCDECGQRFERTVDLPGKGR